MSARLMMLIGKVRGWARCVGRAERWFVAETYETCDKPSVTKITGDDKHYITTILCSATT